MKYDPVMFMNFMLLELGLLGFVYKILISRVRMVFGLFYMFIFCFYVDTFLLFHVSRILCRNRENMIWFFAISVINYKKHHLTIKTRQIWYIRYPSDLHDVERRESYKNNCGKLSSKYIAV